MALEQVGVNMRSDKMRGASYLSYDLKVHLMFG